MLLNMVPHFFHRSTEHVYTLSRITIYVIRISHFEHFESGTIEKCLPYYHEPWPGVKTEKLVVLPCDAAGAAVWKDTDIGSQVKCLTTPTKWNSGKFYIRREHGGKYLWYWVTVTWYIASITQTTAHIPELPQTAQTHTPVCFNQQNIWTIPKCN